MVLATSAPWGDPSQTYPALTPQLPYSGRNYSGVGDFLQCQLCKISASSFSVFLEQRSTVEQLEAVAEIICNKYVIPDKTVCTGAVTRMGDIIVPVLAESIFSPDYFCGEFLGYCSSNYYVFYAEDWVDKLLATKPASIQNNDYLNRVYAQIAADPKPRPMLKAVQISDPHIDFEYTVGADAKCGGFLCCRAVNGLPQDPLNAAGPFGSYQCDLPPAVLENMLTYVRDEIAPDMFFWTGDNSPHNVWGNDNQEVGNATYNITVAIQAAFKQSNISVYPIQGNHDTWPVNVQDFSVADSNIPINEFSGSWAQWLDPDTLNAFTDYGYYSTALKLRDGRVFPKTRIIGLNTQACNNMNWELVKNRYDPGQEIEWLQKELAQLEAMNGSAIFITHIPTNGDCLHGWGHRFRGLMERYQHVIRFGLFGHTHDESVSVVKSVSSSQGNGTAPQNIGINFIAGSLTTYTDKNPSFTLIEIDEEFMVPVNFKTYYYDVLRANKEGKITWELFHDFKTYYGLKDLRPDELAAFAGRIQ